VNLRIVSKRLTVVPFDISMAQSVHLNSLDDDNRRFLPDEVFETVDDAADTIEYLIGCYGDYSRPQVYAVLLDGVQIGHVQLVPCGDGFEVGYHIGKTYTGRGYASEAASAFLPVIMRCAGISCVYGICHAENAASVRVLEKCGFSLVYSGDGMYQGESAPVVKFEYGI